MVLVYYDAPYLTIEWDEEHKCVVMHWRGFSSDEDYREGANKAYELLKEKKASRYLSNMSQMKVISREDQLWTTEDWIPRMMAAGLKRLATVVPVDAPALGSLNAMRRQVAGLPLLLGRFKDINEAKQWISSPNLEGNL